MVPMEIQDAYFSHNCPVRPWFMMLVIYYTNMLLECISPSTMLPEHRLATLFDQVKQHQISSCIYHNTYMSPSLYQDHTCDRSNFPLRPVLELDKHSGEIWDTKFSHDGTLLASCGSDGVVVLYNVPEFDVHLVLSEHEAGICSFAWSPDDTRMVTCGRDKRAMLWNTAVSLNSTSQFLLLI